MKKNNVLLLSLIFLFAIVTPFVFGASNNILDNVLQPFKGLNLGATYLQYAPFIDAIIYFWFFIVLTKGIFKEKFPTSVATAVGVILGIAMSVFEYNSHFNLGALGPLAALIFFLVPTIMLVMWVKSLGGSGALAFSIGFLIFYSLITTIAKPLLDWINKVPFLSAILALGLVAAIIALIIGIGKLFGNIKTGKFALDRDGREIARENRETALKDREEKKALKKLDKAKVNIAELDRHMKNMTDSLAKLADMEDR